MSRNQASKLAGVLPLMLCILAAAPAAHAQNKAKPPVVAKVESLQLPVWVERGGIKTGVKAGWALYAGDRLMTGATGRLSLTLVGDARLMLSGNAAMEFTDAKAAVEEAASLFKVSRGAFQFTAPVISRPEGTLLILGTKINTTVFGGQVWGRVNFNRGLLVLMAGSVEVSGPKFAAVRMTKPESVMVITEGGRAQPVIPVAKEKLAQWLGQVQPVARQPALTAGGLWDVSLGSGYQLKELEELACAMQSRGVPSEISEVRETGKKSWYRVVVRRFATRDDAIEFARTGKNYGAKDAWVLLPQS